MIGTIVTYALLPLVILYIGGMVIRREFKFTGYIEFVLGLSLIVQIGIRSYLIMFPALTTLFDCLILLSGVLLIVEGYLTIKDKISTSSKFGITIASLIFLLIALSPIAPDSLKPPIPALQSNWLLIHVSFAFIGEAFFTIAFVFAILVINRGDEAHYSLMVKTIYIGYPFYVAGAILFGAIWASSAWGSFWSWDPKETWALITSLIYTLYLHLRLFKKINKKMEATLVIVAFLSSMFTLFGVNFLLEGLHSYR